MKLIDLTNQKFGKLTVLKRDLNNPKKGTYWICQCDCGKIVSLRRDVLTRQNKPQQSCGCDLKERNSKAHLKNEIGNKYGKLTVLYRVSDVRKGEARWHCICDCGNECDVSGVHLRNGSVQSCGCKKFESHNGIDETGKRYGKLQVLYKSKKTDGTHIFWHCKCDCGNECDINGSYLRSGISSNCGCERSVGELKINNILKKNNINFKREYNFPDLLGVNGGRLRFDFGILNNQNELLYLIEYDGIQHYKPNCFGQDDQLFKIIKIHDKLKNEYCIEHNIPLIRIPYTQLNNITINDLTLKGDDYYKYSETV